MSKKKPRSVSEFLRARRMKQCVVCKLKATLRAEMMAARQRGILVGDIMDWLASEHGITLTREQIRLHYGGLHEGLAGRVSR